MTRADTLAHATCEECGDTFIRAPGESWKASPAAKKAARDKLAQRVRNHPTPRRVLRARYEFDYDIRKGIRTSIRTATRTGGGRSTQLGTQQNSGARHEVSG